VARNGLQSEFVERTAAKKVRAVFPTHRVRLP
jgi:hypothetical protein